MTVPVAFRVEARNDLVDASTWYEDQAAGLSENFFQRVDEALTAMSERPRSFPLVRKDVRRALVPHFPYAIYFRIKRRLYFCPRHRPHRALASSLA
jgi:hypothetical protein